MSPGLKRIFALAGAALFITLAPLMAPGPSAVLVRSLQPMWPFQGSSFANACTTSGAAGALALHHLVATAVGLVALLLILRILVGSVSTAAETLDPNAGKLRWIWCSVAAVAVFYFTLPLVSDGLSIIQSCDVGGGRLFKAGLYGISAWLMYNLTLLIVWATSKPRTAKTARRGDARA